MSEKTNLKQGGIVRGPIGEALLQRDCVLPLSVIKEKLERPSIAIGCNVMIEVRDGDTGPVIARQEGHNLVVNEGLDIIRDMLGGDLNEEPTDIAVGTDNTAVVATDTTMGLEVFRNQITRRLDSAQQITFQLFISTTQANGNTLVEAGLFRVKNQVDRLFARIVYLPIVKTVSVSVTYTWQVTLAAS